MQIIGLVTSQCGHSDLKSQILNICANTKSPGLKFCMVDEVQELHIVVVVMKSP